MYFPQIAQIEYTQIPPILAFFCDICDVRSAEICGKVYGVINAG